MKILPLSDELLSQCLALTVSPDQKKHNKAPDHILSEAQENQDTVRIFVLNENAPQVIGMASYFNNTHRGFGYWISQFFIDHRYQNRGLGKEAFALLLAEIRLTANHRIIVSVDKENTPAIRLYQKFGFVWMPDEKYPNEQIFVLQL
jgi:diamine N-acetyltransferase